MSPEIHEREMNRIVSMAPDVSGSHALHKAARAESLKNTLDADRAVTEHEPERFQPGAFSSHI